MQPLKSYSLYFFSMASMRTYIQSQAVCSLIILAYSPQLFLKAGLLAIAFCSESFQLRIGHN